MTIIKSKCGKCSFVGPVADVRLPADTLPRRVCKTCEPQTFDAAAEAQKDAWLRGEAV